MRDFGLGVPTEIRQGQCPSLRFGQRGQRGSNFVAPHRRNSLFIDRRRGVGLVVSASSGARRPLCRCDRRTASTDL